MYTFWLLKFWLLDFLFHFPEKPSLLKKVSNVLWAVYLEFLWAALMILFLTYAFNFPAFQLREVIQGNITVYAAEKIFGPKMRYIFFFTCIMAPLWEESVFRYFAIRVGQLGDKLMGQSWLLFPMILVSSIVFGILHGSVLNILFQGFGGLVLCWLYLKNGNSYWSVVITHALWNFIIIFAGLI